MPIDARISMGLRPQTYDAFAAYDTGRQNEQTFRANQMAQQAAQATAARNAMVRERAATVDYGDRNSVNEFIRMAGPDAAPYLEAAGAGDTLFNARAAEARAGGEYARKARGEDRGFMQSALAAVYNDPSDTSIAAVRAQALAAGIAEADFDAYASRFLAAPVEQRRALLANELATTPEGLKLLERFTPAYDMQDAGGSIVPVQTNPLAPGATPPRPIAVTADPTKYTDVPTVDGLVRVYADGRSELLRGPSGAPLTPAPSPEQQRADAEAAAERAAADLAARNAAKTNQTTVQNTRRVVGEILPNVSGWTAGLGSLIAAIPGTPAADLAANLDTLEANLSFERLAEMRANSPTGGALGQITVRELDLLGATIANIRNSQSPEQLRRNLQVIDGALARLEAAYAEAGLPSPVSGGGAPPTPAPSGGGRATHRNAQGQGIYWNGSAWVPGT
jgi:hypothetical protein